MTNTIILCRAEFAAVWKPGINKYSGNYCNCKSFDVNKSVQIHFTHFEPSILKVDNFSFSLARYAFCVGIWLESILCLI